MLDTKFAKLIVKALEMDRGLVSKSRDNKRPRFFSAIIKLVSESYSTVLTFSEIVGSKRV